MAKKKIKACKLRLKYNEHMAKKKIKAGYKKKVIKTLEDSAKGVGVNEYSSIEEMMEKIRGEGD